MSGKADRLQKLEAVRGLAATYMLVHHYVHCNGELAFLSKYFIFGQTAVMVFFILSGFVIYYSTAGRDPNFKVRDYLVRRFRRIYPAFVLVLLIHYALLCFLQHKWVAFDLKNFLGNLLMLQDKQHPFTWFEPFEGNSPLWSLSYEWWFYLLLLPVWFLLKAWPQRQQYLAAGISLTGFISYLFIPNQFSIIAGYFMMWWSGVELGREYVSTGRVTFRRQAFTLGILALNAAFWVAKAYVHYQEVGYFDRGAYPFVQVQHQATVLMMVVGGIAWYKLRWIGFDWTVEVFRHFSPVSYVLYILHLPLILFAANVQLTGSVWLDILWLFPLIYGLSWLIEVPIQRKINQWIR